MPAVAEAPPVVPSSPGPGTDSIATAAQSAKALGGGASSQHIGGAGKGMLDAFSALEARSTEDEKDQPTPKQIREGRKAPTKAAAPAKPAEKEEAAPKDETAKEETAPEQERPAEQKAETAPAAKAGAKRPSDYMREEIVKLKTERDQYKAEVEKVKGQTPAEHPEVKSLSEKLTAAEKRAQQYEETLRTTAYERSEEFKAKYDQPFLDAYAAGASKVKALGIVDPESGEKRAGTLQDWESIASAPSEEEAASRIEQLYGTGVRAQMVTQHYMDAVGKFHNKQQALQSAQKTATERQTQIAELQTKMQKEVHALWEAQTKLEAVPDQWKPYIAPKGSDKDGKPIDADWDAALQKGFERYDKCMTENANDPSLSTEQRKEIISRAAAVRNQAAAFRPLVQQVRKQTTLIAELQAELEAYRKSEPGAGEGATEEAAPAGDGQAGSMASSLANLERLGREGTPTFF